MVGTKDYAALTEAMIPFFIPRNSISHQAPTKQGEGAVCARAVRQCLNLSVKNGLGWLSHLVLDL